MNSLLRERLLTEGFCVFRDLLSPEMIAELTAVTDSLLGNQSDEERQRYQYQGSNIQIAYQHPVFARLFAWPNALAALDALGFPNPKFWSGFLLSKPPYAPPLYWHQDWWAWDDPCSAEPEPAQVFLMYYLTDTSQENGCLRVIPGTHIRRVPLHDQLPAAHTEETYSAPLDSPIFQSEPDEVSVPVLAGDLVIGDARLLHAAHGNRTPVRRTCLTLWYLPDFDHLSEPIQARAGRRTPPALPDWWEGDAGKPVEPLLAYYHGDAAPIPWNRVPGRHLR